MSGIARVGDLVGAGGLLTFPASTNVFVNGRPVALVGAIYTSHPPCSPKQPQHCYGATMDIPYGVFVNGLPPITKNGYGWCGHKVMTASPDVSIAGGFFDLAASLAGLGGAGAPSGLSFTESTALQVANSQTGKR